MTPLSGNRQQKPYQQSQKSLLSKSSYQQQQLDYSSLGKSTQPVSTDDNTKTISCKKSIQNIAYSLASKRLKEHHTNNQDEQNLTHYLINFESETPINRNLAVNGFFEEMHRNNKSDRKSVIDQSFYSTLKRNQTPLKYKTSNRKSSSQIKNRPSDFSTDKYQHHQNDYQDNFSLGKIIQNDRPMQPIQINKMFQQNQENQQKNQDHFNNIIIHLRKIHQTRNNPNSNKKKDKASSSFNTTTNSVFEPNKLISMIQSPLAQKRSLLSVSRQQEKPSTSFLRSANTSIMQARDLSQRVKSSMNNHKDQYDQQFNSQRPQTQYKQVRDTSQFVLFGRQQLNQDDNKATRSSSGNTTNFIRKNFYMIKQQPSQLQSDIKDHEQKQFSGMTQNIGLLIKQKIYQNNNNNSEINQSQRNTMSERVSAAYQKMKGYDNQTESEYSYKKKVQGPTFKKQIMANENQIRQKVKLLNNQSFLHEISNHREQKNKMESCIIPNLPIIDQSQSQNLPFFEFLKEIRKEFTVELCQNKDGQIFNGLYAQDKAKGLGKQFEANGNIYKGNFQDNQKKGPGLQLFLQPISKQFDVYRGEWSNDQPNGKGIYYYHSTDIFIEGIFKDGNPEQSGNFKIRYPNGDVYEGYIQNKRKSGKGKLYYQNGDYYEGEWIANKREGRGRFYIKSEDINIEGNFANDEISNGKLIDKQGNIYTTIADDLNPGHFTNGKLQGKVKIEYVNTNVFIGYLADGKRSGQGKMIYNDLKMIQDEQELINVQRNQELDQTSKNSKSRKGSTIVTPGMKPQQKTLLTETGEYEGSWKRDMRDGYGVIKWFDGSKFEGLWKDNQRIKGKMAMQDGTVYEGEFQNDKYHGLGSITMRLPGRTDGIENRKIFTGYFEDGKVPAQGKIYYTNTKDTYYGQHSEYERVGFGYLFSQSGIKFQGYFLDDRKEGIGFQWYPNGDYYHGEFSNDKKEGVGRFYYNSDQNKIFEGYWTKDERNGEGYLIDPTQNIIIKGNWRSGKLEGKAVIMNMNDIGSIQILREKGIQIPSEIRDIFKLPDDLRKL